MPRSRIWIEVIVDVQSVDIVTPHDVGHDATDVLAVLGHSRIEYHLAAVCKRSARLPRHYVGGSQAGRSRCLGTVWVNPGMQFHAAAVALVNHPCQRVPVRGWRLALHPGEEAAPRFVRAGIKRIALCPHLKEYGIDTVALQLVELAGKRLLHGLRSHAGELSVDTLYPRSAELTLMPAVSSSIARARAARKQGHGRDDDDK